VGEWSNAVCTVNLSSLHSGCFNPCKRYSGIHWIGEARAHFLSLLGGDPSYPAHKKLFCSFLIENNEGT
jgi:hypothetical protein